MTLANKYDNVNLLTKWLKVILSRFIFKLNKNDYNIVYYFIQLPKFIEQVREINTPEEEWLAYLSCSLSEEEKGELYKMNRSIEEVNKIVDIVMKDKDVQEELRYRVLDKQLEQLKEMRAYENGEKEKTEKIVKQMISLNVDDEIIVKSTGITKEELEEIMKNMNR